VVEEGMDLFFASDAGGLGWCGHGKGLGCVA
jgi:hypothetical protein